MSVLLKYELPVCSAYLAPRVSGMNLLSFAINADLSVPLQAIADAKGVSVLVIVAAAFKALVGRYSGESDLCVTIVSTESYSQWHSVINGEQSVSSVIEQMIGSFAQAQPISAGPAQVVLALNEEIDVNSIHAEWALGISQQNMQIKLDWHFDGERFDVSLINKGFGHLQQLLGQLVSQPEIALAKAAILDLSEREAILNQWNETQAAPIFSDHRFIHDGFEQQVARKPEAVALVCDGQQMSYGQLNERATKLAHHLRSLGIGPGQLVGICLPRSFDVVVAILGVAKSQAAYVPLDTDWPNTRVHRVLDSNEFKTVALITDSSRMRLAHDLQWDIASLKDIILIDTDTQSPEPESFDSDLVSQFWDQISEAAEDRAAAAGFISESDEQVFSDQEVDQYRDQVVAIAKPWLDKSKNVLEIGCGSGLIGFELAKLASQYTGIDPSAQTQQKNRETAVSQSVLNTRFETGFAHQLDDYPEGTFDLVLLASVAQFFPGPIYFESVLNAGLKRLAPAGVLLIADVMDPVHRKGQEFHIARQWFEQFAAQHPDISAIEIHPRGSEFNNELGLRYDVILHRVPEAIQTATTALIDHQHRRITTGWHIDKSSVQPLENLAKPEDIAYVIYTSGSTGQPKGVMVNHASAVNVNDWINSHYQVNASDRLLFVASVCFDLSVYDIFGTLSAGASLHIAQTCELRDPEYLASLLQDKDITIWDSAPAGLAQLMPLYARQQNPGSTSLRLVLLSGDWIPISLPAALAQYFPNAQIKAMGGATEATIWSNYYPIDQVNPLWVSIPYGKPIANARYHVLDEHLQPCPIGVRGDLYIGGDCLAVGYIDDQVLTQSKFIPNPFTNQGRLYKTGDQARYWTDGNLEFLGRIDSQVKINGYRIELGEIEAALLTDAIVSAAIAIVREDVPGDRKIVLYYVDSVKNPVSQSEIQTVLSDKLPSYMLPAALMQLSSIPLTVNGKVARDQLPLPQGDDSAAPSNETESQLLVIWKDVLGINHIGIHDHFFQLGGHSMILTTLLFNIESQFGVKISFRDGYRNPTIAQQAVLIEAANGTTEEEDYQYAFDLMVGDDIATFYVDLEDFDPDILPEGAINIRTVKGEQE